MSLQQFAMILALERESFLPDFSRDELKSVLTAPRQNSLGDAIAADAVDSAPAFGLVPALVRYSIAQEEGVEYPRRPDYVDRFLEDLPAPADEVVGKGAQFHTLEYLERVHGIEPPEDPQNITEEKALELGNQIRDVLEKEYL